MLSLMLIVAVAGLTMAVFLYVGSMFLQGYIYTEPSAELYWQAPATAAAMTVFFLIWCLLVVFSDGASPRNIPYDTLFRFNPQVDLLNEPAKEIWAVKKNGEKKPYGLEKLGQTTYRYVDKMVSPYRPWRNDGVDSAVIVIDNESRVFKRIPGTKGSNSEYVSDQGWVMKDYGDGPTGVPTIFRWGRFVMNLFLNFVHFVIWWLCLWLVMRFSLGHAFGLALVLWVILTLIVLPMLLTNAAEVAQGRSLQTAQVLARMCMISPS